MIESQAGQHRSTAPSFGGASHLGDGLTSPRARLHAWAMGKLQRRNIAQRPFHGSPKAPPDAGPVFCHLFQAQSRAPARPYRGYQIGLDFWHTTPVKACISGPFRSNFFSSQSAIYPRLPSQDVELSGLCATKTSSEGCGIVVFGTRRAQPENSALVFAAQSAAKYLYNRYRYL
jgi:hypothetical protein